MSHKKEVKIKTPTIQEFKKENIMPLVESEAGYFQALVNASNNCGKVLQNKAKSEWVIKSLEEIRNKIVKDEITLPVNITLIPNLVSYPESNKKKVLEIFDEQIKSYKQQLLAINGQVEHQHEEYVEIAIRVRDFMAKRYGGQTTKFIALDPNQRTPTAGEITLFESEFDKLVKEKDGKANPNYDPKKVKEFQEAKEKAIKMNAELRKRKA